MSMQSEGTANIAQNHRISEGQDKFVCYLSHAALGPYARVPTLGEIQSINIPYHLQSPIGGGSGVDEHSAPGKFVYVNKLL